MSTASVESNVSPLVYDVPAVAQALCISKDLVRKLIYTRSLPVVRLGDRVLVRREDLAEFLAARVEKGL